MATKSGSGGDHDDDPSSGGSGSSRTGQGSGNLSVDTEGLFRGGGNFESMGSTVHSFARSFTGAVSRAPLINGQTDDSWTQFAPEYIRGSQTFMDGVNGIAQAVTLIAQSVYGFAEFCANTEENAAYMGKNALNLNPPADSGGGGKR